MCGRKRCDVNGKIFRYFQLNLEPILNETCRSIKLLPSGSSFFVLGIVVVSLQPAAHHFHF